MMAGYAFHVSNFHTLLSTDLNRRFHHVPKSTSPSPPTSVADRFSFSSQISLQFPAGSFTNSFTQGNYFSCMYWRSQLTEQLVCFTRQLHYKTFTSHSNFHTLLSTGLNRRFHHVPKLAHDYTHRQSTVGRHRHYLFSLF